MARIGKLESIAPRTALCVVPVYPGETNGQAIAYAGIAPAPSDLVVLIHRFSSSRHTDPNRSLEARS